MKFMHKVPCLAVFVLANQESGALVWNSISNFVCLFQVHSLEHNAFVFGQETKA
jgi:hypothetical protein